MNSPFEGVLRPLDHGPTRAAAEMEREVLRSLGGGCLAPIGVYASVRGSEARMVAQVLSVDGRESIEADAAFLTSEAVPAAHALAERLRKSGAEALLARAATESP
jgi:hydroxymethylbilane synthase